jgi:hypothetical protein
LISSKFSVDSLGVLSFSHRTGTLLTFNCVWLGLLAHELSDDNELGFEKWERLSCQSDSSWMLSAQGFGHSSTSPTGCGGGDITAIWSGVGTVGGMENCVAQLS